jgi:hypothetical protein
MRRKGIGGIVSEEVSASLSREFLKFKTIRMKPFGSQKRPKSGRQIVNILFRMVHDSTQG